MFRPQHSSGVGPLAPGAWARRSHLTISKLRDPLSSPASTRFDRARAPSRPRHLGDHLERGLTPIWVGLVLTRTKRACPARQVRTLLSDKERHENEAPGSSP